MNIYLARLLEKSGISTQEANQIFIKHQLIENPEEAYDPKTETLNEYNFSTMYRNNRLDLDQLTKAEFRFMKLDEFILGAGDEKLLDAYYKHYKTIPTTRISADNREFVYNYLIQKNETKRITYGLDQKYDIQMIKDNIRFDDDLDFINWNDMSLLDIFDDVKYRPALLHRLIELYYYSAMEGNNYAVLADLYKNHNGFEILALAQAHDTDVYENMLYDIFSNFHLNEIEIMEALSKFYVEQDTIVFDLVTRLKALGNHNFQNQYINIDSVVRYVKNAYMHRQSGDYIYSDPGFNYFCSEYRNFTTAIHDERLKQEYESSPAFRLPPCLIFNFRSVETRYNKTGELNLKDILKCEISPPAYSNFVEFMLKLSSEKVSELIKFDCDLSLDVMRSQRLSFAQNAELIAQHPELLVYFVDML